MSIKEKGTMLDAELVKKHEQGGMVTQAYHPNPGEAEARGS